MSLNEVFGQQQVVQLLKRGLRTGRIAHAYCFAGPRGVGKTRTAQQLAKALNCLNGKEDACDECIHCQRIDHGNDPGVMKVSPDGQTIKIDQVRAIQRAFSYSPPENATRVIMIEHADAMTVQAANSLLKFLEEPTSRMVAILITENLHALLPTIRSRCQLLRFPALSPERIAQYLKEEGYDPETSRIAAHLAAGLDDARGRMEEDEFALLCERVIKWSGEIASGSSEALVSVQTQILETGRERLETVLDLLLLWLRDLLNDRLGREEQPVFARWSESRRRQSSRWTIDRLTDGMHAIIDARRQLAGPVQAQAVLERMVLVMQGGAVNAVSRRSPF
ncbi:DNA polymerase III subunit delta' [Paludifilum halophilum]|uniref:DNA polymerase III subunit delta' n=1 Tax=Paludifilum halophilum TaxID=1642702 RepID=UPI00146C87C4|nr:DNA polymerase III subunit delta' [Paludifilum halophilum]